MLADTTHRLIIHSRGLFRTQWNTQDEAFCENSEQLKDVHYFHKRFHLRCPTRFWHLGSQVAVHRFVESHLTSRKWLNSQLATHSLLSLHFTNMQVAGRIVESLSYQNSVLMLVWNYFSWFVRVFLTIGSRVIECQWLFF